MAEVVRHMPSIQSIYGCQAQEPAFGFVFYNINSFSRAPACNGCYRTAIPWIAFTVLRKIDMGTRIHCPSSPDVVFAALPHTNICIPSAKGS
jgi:hypothetical protein